MTLPTSGTLTSAQLAQEMYGDSTRSVTIPDADTRALAGKPTGTLIFPDDFYGKSAAPAGVTLTSAQVNSGWYGYSRLDTDTYGAISPAGASAIPGAAASAGAHGEIVRLVSTFDGEGFWDLRIIVRGSFASPPFSSVTVDQASTFTTGWTTSAISSNTQFRWTGTRTTNIFPVGARSIAFT